MNNTGAAEDAFKKAVQFTGEIYPSVNLATLYINEGRLDEAQDVITRLCRRMPHKANSTPPSPAFTSRKAALTKPNSPVSKPMREAINLSGYPSDPGDS